jgi:hypothetical protein
LGGADHSVAQRMSPSLSVEVERVGGDPSDPVWRWLLLNGPHGNSFTWSQTRSEPPGYVGIEHLECIVAEHVRITPDFLPQAQQAVAQAMASAWPDILCRALQVAAVVGSDAELQSMASLTSHEDASVSAHAKAALFYLKRRLRAATPPGSRKRPPTLPFT